jgi:predicted RNA-binding Zn-ribbon protein involved in translation (DUF1610 family)
LSQERLSSSESLVKTRSMGVFRCHNCFERVSPPSGVKTFKCPNCGFEWRIIWISPDVPRIRGPVWETNRRLAEEAVSKKGGGST